MRTDKSPLCGSNAPMRHRPGRPSLGVCPSCSQALRKLSRRCLLQHNAASSQIDTSASSLV